MTGKQDAGTVFSGAITPTESPRRGWSLFGAKDDKPSDFAPTGRPADPDFLLVRAHLAGDPKAFETLFKKYQTPIFSMVTRMVRGEEAYDLTQDVFLKALRAMPTFRGDSKVSTWLYTIARHTCLNYIRHKNVIEEESLQESQDENANVELVDTGFNVGKMVEVRELQRAVEDVLSTMPTEARMLLVLRDFEQLSYDEISQVTELSIVNVKSKIHRARLAFKKRFQPYLDLIEGGIG
ncbi:MAG: sigma-70 family RNA polymerase sigma factor [Armatimonadetes bacterium]|nr:sigma-70 family RNA polymerase sigma factor [Armatimonadota bacterium]